MGRKKGGKKRGRRWERERGNKRRKKGKSKKDCKKLFTLANQTGSFYTGKGLYAAGESTSEFCQHLTTTTFEKGPMFLGLQRRVRLLPAEGSRRCGISSKRGCNLSFLCGFLPSFQCKMQATISLTTQIRILEGITLFELHFCFSMFPLSLLFIIWYKITHEFRYSTCVDLVSFNKTSLSFPRPKISQNQTDFIKK